MSRKSLLLGFATLFMLACLGAGLALAVKHEPNFYLKSALPPGKERKQRSGQFVQDFNQFCQDAHDSRVWSGHFEQDCLNSFFDEHFVASGLDVRVLPDGISAPRISFAPPDRIRFGFRYGKGLLSTIIAIDMRVWLASQAPNVVALELQGLHAGALPVAAQSLLERISEAARQNNIDVSWYRHDGHPVALLRFQADQDRPTVKIEHLCLKPGVLEIQGRSMEVSTPRAEPAAEQAPANPNG
jgi:hypothetical protein